MGPPSLYWLDTGWWCFDYYIVVFFLYALPSFFPTRFLPLLFDFFSLLLFVKIEASHLHSLFVENGVGLLGLPYFVLPNWARGPFKVFPLFLISNSYKVGPLGFLPHSFFFGPIQEPFSFL